MIPRKNYRGFTAAVAMQNSFHLFIFTNKMETFSADASA
jgi:hypothetical protein